MEKTAMCKLAQEIRSYVKQGFGLPAGHYPDGQLRSGLTAFADAANDTFMDSIKPFSEYLGNPWASARDITMDSLGELWKDFRRGKQFPVRPAVRIPALRDAIPWDKIVRDALNTSGILEALNPNYKK